MLDALVAAHGRGAQLVGLHLGTYVLAEAGLLDGRKATTHWAWAQDFAQRYPEVHLDADVLYVEDDNILTGAGAGAGIDCCLELLRRWHGASMAHDMARMMVVPPHRQGSQTQVVEQLLPDNTRDNRLSDMLDWLRLNLQVPHSLDSLAKTAHMSKRSFTRHFRQLTGATVGDWLLNERLTLSQRLLETTNHSIENIAELAGFGSPTLLRHHFSNAFEMTPTVWRQTHRSSGSLGQIQADLRFFECLDRINRIILEADDLTQMMDHLLNAMLSIFDCDRAYLLYSNDPSAATYRVPMERTRPEYPRALAPGVDLPIDEEVAARMKLLLEHDGPVKFGPSHDFAVPKLVAERFGVKSLMAVALYPKIDKPWHLGMHQCSRARAWSREETRLFQEIGRRLGDSLTVLIARRTLGASQQSYQSLAENSPYNIIRYDSDCRAIYANQHFETTINVGANFGSHLGQTSLEYAPNVSYIKNYQETLQRTILTGESEEIEVQVPTPAGPSQTHNIRFVAERDLEGNIIGALAYGRDITVIKEAERQALSNLRHFEWMDRVNQAILGTTDLTQMTYDVLQVVLEVLDCDRVYLLYPCDPGSPTYRVPMERTRAEYPGILVHGREVPMDEFVAGGMRLLLEHEGPVKFGPTHDYAVPAFVEERFGVRSSMVQAIYPKTDKPWQLGIQQCSRPRSWTQSEEQFARQVGQRLADGLTSLLLYRDLCENNLKLQAVLSNLPGAVFQAVDQADGGTIFTYFSDGIQALTGRTPEEALEVASNNKSIHPDDVELLRNMREERRHTGQSSAPLRLIKKDGGTLWVMVRSREIAKPDGLVVISGLIMDISREMEARHALERSEAEQKKTATRLEIIIDNLPGVAYRARVTPTDRELTYLGGSFERHYGLPASQFMSMSQAERTQMVHPDDQAVFASRWRDLEAKGEVVARARFFRPDGQVRWFEYHERIVEQLGNEIISEGLVLDVTDQVAAKGALERSKEELRETANRLKTIIDNLPGVVYRVRISPTSRELTYLSDFFEQQYGLSSEQFLGMPYLERDKMFHPDDRKAFGKRWPELNATGKCLSTARYYHPDGKMRWFEYHERVLKRQVDTILVEGLVLDITKEMIVKESLEQVDRTLRYIVQHGWRPNNDDFLTALAHHLAEALSVDYVVIDRLCAEPGIAETVVLYAKGQVVPNTRYALEHTPCANIVGKGLCCYPSGVQHLFPLDTLLVDMGVESYIGIPLWGSDDKVSGLIALMDSRALDDRVDLAQKLLQIVATRAGAELEREKIRLESERQEEKLRIAATAFEIQDGMFITDASQVILQINRAFCNITGFTTEEAIGQTPRLLKSGRHGHAFYADMWNHILKEGAWAGEIWNRRKNGETYPEWLSITAVKNQHGETSHYIGTFSDISARKEAEKEIERLAFYDPLTELPNRRLLLDRLKHVLAGSPRRKDGSALLFIDLDNFKVLNDTFGHDIGDMLLVAVAQRLMSCVRESDTVSRLGGDEFVVILESLSENRQEAAAQAENIGNNILSAFKLPFVLNGRAHHSTPSIGITLFFGDSLSMDDLLKQADIAMYQAKAAGRNTLRFFDLLMQIAIAERTALESMLRMGINEQQFVLHYQPQVNGDNTVIGAEALLRWEHPEEGMISPARFIPLAEETGLILPIGQWVIEAACEAIRQWSEDPLRSQLTLAVNVSARQFRQPDFVESVQTALIHSGAMATRLKLELTESLVLDDIEDTIKKMRALKSIGVGFSMDDFGTGYSSLSYLTRLPLDQIKIDQSFVRNLPENANDAVVVQTIISMTKGLGMFVIAEGVETIEQRQFLGDNGCSTYQGYLFSKPVPLAQFEQLLGY